MIQSLREGFGRYADFSGRTQRRPFWYFITLTQLVLLAVGLPLLLIVFRSLLFLSDDLGVTLMGAVGRGATPEELVRDWVHPQDLLSDTWYYAGQLWMEQPGLYLMSAVLTGAVAVLICCPSLAVTARRLRDAGRSPWWASAFVMACLPLPGILELGCLLSLYTLRLCALPTQPQKTLPPVPVA